MASAEALPLARHHCHVLAYTSEQQYLRSLGGASHRTKPSLFNPGAFAAGAQIRIRYRFSSDALLIILGIDFTQGPCGGLDAVDVSMRAFRIATSERSLVPDEKHQLVPKGDARFALGQFLREAGIIVGKCLILALVAKVLLTMVGAR